jgi:hypothetical protein
MVRRAGWVWVVLVCVGAACGSDKGQDPEGTAEVELDATGCPESDAWEQARGAACDAPGKLCDRGPVCTTAEMTLTSDRMRCTDEGVWQQSFGDGAWCGHCPHPAEVKENWECVFEGFVCSELEGSSCQSVICENGLWKPREAERDDCSAAGAGGQPAGVVGGAGGHGD